LTTSTYETQKLRAADLDVLEVKAEQGVTLAFSGLEPTTYTVHFIGLIEGTPEEIASEGIPFVLGAHRDVQAGIVPEENYTLPDQGTSFTKVYNTSPTSGHPDGQAYIESWADDDYIYFSADWTSDNTFDYGDDFFAVHLNQNGLTKTYKVSSNQLFYKGVQPVDTRDLSEISPLLGGQAQFRYTDKVAYEHMTYTINIPRTELASANPFTETKVGFELYGTAPSQSSITPIGSVPSTAQIEVPITFDVGVACAPLEAIGCNNVLVMAFDYTGYSLANCNNDGHKMQSLFAENGNRLIEWENWGDGNNTDCDSIYANRVGLEVVDYSTVTTAMEQIPASVSVTIPNSGARNLIFVAYPRLNLGGDEQFGNFTSTPADTFFTATVEVSSASTFVIDGTDALCSSNGALWTLSPTNELTIDLDAIWAANPYIEEVIIATSATASCRNNYTKLDIVQQSTGITALSIQGAAFQQYIDGDGTNSLQSVTFPEGLQSLSIGSAAFQQSIVGDGTNSLQSVTFPEGLQSLSIGSAAFQQIVSSFDGTNSLTYVNFPSGLQSLNIEGAAFLQYGKVSPLSSFFFSTSTAPGSGTNSVTLGGAITCKPALDAMCSPEPESNLPWSWLGGEAGQTSTTATSWTTTLSDVSQPYNLVTVAPVKIWRLYNHVSGEHLYTRSDNEATTLATQEADWAIEESNGWTAPDSGVPVHRLYNPISGDHHYTTDLWEVHVLSAEHNWVDEDVAYFSQGYQPVHRLFNPEATIGTHHYTTDDYECDVLDRETSWIDEGVGWRGLW
jgi:hypothetical protein